MDYKERLDIAKSELKFLELSLDKNLGKITLPKGFVIPINIESVQKLDTNSFDFNFFHIIQNMLFCIAMCDDLPLNVQYKDLMNKIFNKPDKVLLQNVYNLEWSDDNFYKAGVLLGFTEYIKDQEIYLSCAYEFMDLYHSDSSEEYLSIAKELFLKTFDIEKTAYTAYLLSYIYHSEKNYDLALEYAEISLELEPAPELKENLENDLIQLRTSLHLSVVHELMDENDYLSALDYLKTNQVEGSWEHSYMLGEIYLALENPEQALENLKTALELNPSEADIYESLGIATYYMGDITNSIKFLEHGLKLEPKHSEILKNLSTLYAKTGRSDIAIKLLDKAKIFYPDDEELDIIVDRIQKRMDI